MVRRLDDSSLCRTWILSRVVLLRALPVSPNKHMLRAVTHKVLGRGRVVAALCRAPRARVLIGLRAGADVSRWAT